MGAFRKIIAVLSRPLKNWNVEHRAQKLVEKQAKGKKPALAPRHSSAEEDKINKENLELLKLQQEKNSKLHEMLEGIVVNPERMGEIRSKSRPLPEHRGRVADVEFGFHDPTNIPKGRCSLKQSLVFIANHQTDPEKYTSDVIAKEYDVNRKDVDMVLRYFQTLQIQLPDGSEFSDGLTAEKAPKYVGPGNTNSHKPGS